MKTKIKFFLVIFFLAGIMLLSLSSAGMFDWIKKTVTGKATQIPFDVNITVGGPQIIRVFNMSETPVTINEGPMPSFAIINFSVYMPIGVENLNLSTALVNLSYTNEDTRTNSTCKNIAYSGTSANFTCNVRMWWWDVNGTWTITAFIRDNASNGVINNTATQFVGLQRAITGAPSIITWPGISPGSHNSSSNNHPIRLNNTGNYPIMNLSINATNLRGEISNTELIWAANFSAHWATGGSPSAECNNTARMRHGLFSQVAVANISKGNYTINNGATGQEQIYFCLLYLASNLTTQAYSTATEGSWTASIIPP